MTDINKGDWIKVPKGTTLAVDYSQRNRYLHEETETSRDVVVQVSYVSRYSYWWQKLTDDQTTEWRIDESKIYNDPTKRGMDYWVGVAEATCGHSLMVAEWSNGKKGVFVHQVEKVEAPAPKKKPVPKVNKRQQMVVGSRWKVTQDVTIQYKHRNPLVIQAEADWEKANPRPRNINNVIMVNGVAVFRRLTQEEVDAERKAHREWADAVHAERKRLHALHGEYIIRDHLVLKAGDILKVNGKFLSDWYPGQHFSTPLVTNVVPMLVEGGDGTKYGVEYKQIVEFIEAESIPTVDIYCLRDRLTGKFFKGTSYTTGWKPVWVEEFMKAKHYENVGRAKTQILMATGYYDGLPGADESLPEWAGGGASITITDTMELVHFDKLGRKEVGTVAEFQKWYKRAWELRELTVRYGSAVRTTYKALEKADLLDKQKGMIVFTVTDEAKLDDVGYWGEKTALSEEDKKDIELATASLTKGSFKKAIDHKSMAVSFPNKGAAMMFKLSYAGNLKVTVIDLEEMKEAVDG